MIVLVVAVVGLAVALVICMTGAFARVRSSDRALQHRPGLDGWELNSLHSDIRARC